jgi:hypothetical protein
VVEQRPFKPKVVGSIPTAPTNRRLTGGYLAKTAANLQIRTMTMRMRLRFPFPRHC